MQASPATRRKVLDISDIAGASPKDRGSMPVGGRRDQPTSLPPKSRPLATIHEKGQVGAADMGSKRAQIRTGAYAHIGQSPDKPGSKRMADANQAEKAYYGEQNSSIILKPTEVSRRNGLGSRRMTGQYNAGSKAMMGGPIEVRD